MNLTFASRKAFAVLLAASMIVLFPPATLSASAADSAPTMVADINTSGGSGVSGSTVFDGQLYFAAEGDTNGTELWAYDGTNAPSMVADLRSGASPSLPSYFAVFDGKLYFQANDGTHGTELWVYDGTNAPSMVADLRSGSDGSGAAYFTEFNGKLYFRAYESTTNGTELWVYDGTNAPTLAADIFPGTGNGLPSELTVFSDKLYFMANDGTNGYELWAFDGTNAASLVQDINSSASGAPYGFTVFSNKLYFEARGDTSGTELWVYDGTNDPSIVQDINPGSSSSRPRSLQEFNGKLYFRANDGTNGDELWVYDGTNAATMVEDIYPGSRVEDFDITVINGGYPDDLAVFDGKLYFNATDGVNGKELWSLAMPVAPVPGFATATRTSTGFTAQISNYDNTYTWAVATTVGTASISATGLVTVAGVPANTSATATITSSKTGVTSKAATVTGTSLQQAVFTPTVGLPTSTAAGFTVQVTNYDASYNWSGTANFGNVTVSSTGLVTITGVAASTASIATISASKVGFVPSTVLAAAVALSIAAVAAAEAAAEAAAAQTDNKKLNAGSFKGYVALYAKGYEGQKFSAKVAGKWLKVDVLPSSFERIVRFTGAGYDIKLHMYIDGELLKQMDVLTK